MLVFLDIEATGHGRDKGIANESILEVGFCVTTDDLEQVGGGHQLVKALPGHLEAMRAEVREMHTKNGLLDAIEKEAERTYRAGEPGIRRYEAEAQLVEWFTTFPERFDMKEMTAVGFAVEGDMAFLREHMPRLAKLFSRKVIDLHALGELAKRWNPKLHKGSPKGPGTHRAWTDAAHSLEVLRYYRDHDLFPRPTSAREQEEKYARQVYEVERAAPYNNERR